MSFGFFELFSSVLAGFFAVIPSYGLAIILLTLSTRILLLPLSVKQTRSMREMQVIQPEVKALQKKHKGDRQKMNEEMMKLYKEHGVNPLGGCLPLLMQFPVLIGLFQVLNGPLKYLEHIPDSALANALRDSPIRVHSFGLLKLDCAAGNIVSGGACRTTGEIGGNGIGDAAPYLLLVLLMGFTTWYQQKQMQANRDGDTPQMAQMQMMGRIMPVFLMVISFNFASGLVLYWLTTNVWTIVQQRIMLKAAPSLLPSTGAAADPSPGRGRNGKVDNATSARQKGGPAGKKNRETPAVAPKPSTPRSASKPHPSSKKKKKR